MCGRTACTLCKDDIQGATRRYSNLKKPPKWIEKYSWQAYKPGYNIAPSQVTPVLVKENALCSSKQKDGDVVLFPMKWGLIPSWFKGRIEEFDMKTNNCRYESILERPTYKGPLLSGKRCVILADGFFEWKVVSKGKKQPYFIHFPQDNGTSMSDRKWEDRDLLWTEEHEWNGPRLLTMAGIFDVWKSPEMGDVYSYSVVTMDSSKTAAFVHDRMPAILDGDDQVKMWLDSGKILFKEALCNLEAVEKLEMYPVSTEVNNSRNNTVSCVQPLKMIELNKGKQSPAGGIKRTALTAWLKISPRKESGSSGIKHFKSDE